MSQIQFVSPALKRSTKEFPILNENNETKVKNDELRVHRFVGKISNYFFKFNNI